MEQAVIVPVLVSVLELAAFVTVVFVGLGLIVWFAYDWWEKGE